MSSTSVNRDQQSSPANLDDDNRAPLTNPELDNNSIIWIAFIVVVPIIFTVILCLITACIYRCKKKRAQQNTINSSMTPIDQHNTAIATICVMEDLPPSYELISETKNDSQFITENNNNTNEQLDLSRIKTTTTFTPPPAYASDTTDLPK